MLCSLYPPSHAVTKGKQGSRIKSLGLGAEGQKSKGGRNHGRYGGEGGGRGARTSVTLPSSAAVTLQDRCAPDLPPNVGNNGLRVANRDCSLAGAIKGDLVNFFVDNARLTSGIGVGHAIPSGTSLGVGAISSQVREVDVLVGVGRAKVDIEGEAALVGLRLVGLLAVEHDHSLQIVVSVHRVRTDAAIVRSADVASAHASNLSGTVAVTDDLRHGGVGVIECSYKWTAAVHGDRLPSTGVGVVGHVHLHGRDV
jgi:hypothetical protein